MSHSFEQPASPSGQFPPAVETTTVPGPATSTIGELFARVSDQLTRLVRDELRLAQLQLTEKGKRFGMGGAFLAVAGLVALYALAALIAAAVLGLAVALPAWLSALIVGVVLLVVAGIAALLGKRAIDAAKAVEAKPQDGIKQDVEAIKKGVQR